MIMNTILTTSRNTLNRISRYHSYLKVLLASGEVCVSSVTLAQKFGCDQSGVRKDLKSIGIQGRPHIGFDIISTLDVIEQYLGWQSTTEAVFVGAPTVGLFLSNQDFAIKGLKLLCGFKLGPADVLYTGDAGMEFFPLGKLPGLTRRLGVKAGVLCVPADDAQEAADMMLSGGIQAIWNLSSFELDVPAHVAVENVDFSASFAALAARLAAVNNRF